MLRQAVVLVGGLGTRLGALTADMPKPMLPIGDEPFLDLLLRNLARHGFQDILLLACHQAAKIRDHYASRQIKGARVTVVEEDKPAGTGGALRGAVPLLDDVFLLTNGDTIFDFNYLALYENFLRSRAKVSLALCNVSDVARYGQVTTNGSGRIVRYAEKGGAPGAAGLISGGVYIMSREILDCMPPGRASLETTLMPELVQDGAVSGAEFQGFFLDIGLPDSYARAQNELPLWERRQVVFFDRDGTLNRDEGYTHKIEDLAFLPDVPQMIRRCNDAGRLVIVVSNQSGIARGLYTARDVDRFHQEMNRQLQKYGAHIDGFYYCPHHPKGVIPMYAVSCTCRKPATGLFERACAEWKIDLADATMIGDMDSDLAAAESFGMAALKSNGDNIEQLISSIGL